MLLQAEGIDVNRAVRIIIPIATFNASHPTITFSYYCRWGIFVLFPSTVVGSRPPSRGSLDRRSHRGSGLVVTGRGD